MASTKPSTSSGVSRSASASGSIDFGMKWPRSTSQR